MLVVVVLAVVKILFEATADDEPSIFFERDITEVEELVDVRAFCLRRLPISPSCPGVDGGAHLDQPTDCRKWALNRLELEDVCTVCYAVCFHPRTKIKPAMRD